MAKTSRSRKSKGTRLEKLVSKRIDDVLGDYGIWAKRTPMSGAIEGWKGDVTSNLPIVIECKNQERLNFRDAWRQAKSQAGSKMPILVTSKNNDTENICMIDFEDLLFFMELAIQSGWCGSKRK